MPKVSKVHWAAGKPPTLGKTKSSSMAADQPPAQTEQISAHENEPVSLSWYPKHCFKLPGFDHVEKLLDRIELAVAQGKRKRADYAIWAYLNSYDARRLALETAYRRLPKNKRPKPESLDNIAAFLDAWRGTKETVYLLLQVKPGPNLDYRPILDYGIENRALQYLVLPVLKLHAKLHPSQYALRGTHAAIRRVAASLADGYVWAIESDIRNCFPSFDGDRVCELLPLPEEVTRHALLANTLNVSLAHTFLACADPDEEQQLLNAEFAPVRRGLPQGSAASPLVAEMLLAPLFENLPEGGRSIGYVDNFLAMGKSESGAVSMTEAFWSALEAHPAGQLKAKNPLIYEPGKPIQFLGHQLRLTDGEVVISPTLVRQQEFETTFQEGLAKIKAASSSEKRSNAVSKLSYYVRSWTASFGLCDNIKELRATVLKRIAAAAHGS